MERLREARKAAGLTMKELGYRVGLAESTISHYETGRHEPPYEILTAMAKILDVSVNYLLGVEEKPVEFSDFTYAMHGAEQDLTENDKQILLQMAQKLADANKRK